MAYLAALMRSHFHLLNPAFMLIKVSLVFAEFVAVSCYWEMIIHRPLVCEDHHYHHHFNHRVDYFMCGLVQLHWQVPQDFVFLQQLLNKLWGGGSLHGVRAQRRGRKIGLKGHERDSKPYLFLTKLLFSYTLTLMLRAKTSEDSILGFD